MVVQFSENKQAVRDLQAQEIAQRFEAQFGHLRYLGLSSPGMKDVRDWAAFFSRFDVVERGQEGAEWKDQHELLLTAARCGLSAKVKLLRGDIDNIIRAGGDLYGTSLEYPYDVVTLDYSGGLLYRNSCGEIRRLIAIEQLIAAQGAASARWLLFISVRVDDPLNGEVKRTLQNIRTELNRYGAEADAFMDAVNDHERDEVRYKIYVPYFVNQVAARVHSRCVTAKTIIYEGNNGAQMMNFRFYIRPDERTTAPRWPQERLVQIMNSPFVEIREGEVAEVTLGLPKLRATTTPTE